MSRGGSCLKSGVRLECPTQFSVQWSIGAPARLGHIQHGLREASRSQKVMQSGFGSAYVPCADTSNKLDHLAINSTTAVKLIGG